MQTSIAQLKVLVIDETTSSRAALCALLQSIGVVSVTGVSSLTAARQSLAGGSRHFDVILCEMWFETNGDISQSGISFLDELRRSSLCANHTIVGVVSAESRYTHIYEALHQGLDFYLIKPFNAAAIEEKLKLALGAKSALMPVLEALSAKDYQSAISQAVSLYHNKQKMSAAKLAADLMVSTDQYDQAVSFLNTVPLSDNSVWAQIELAKLESRKGGQKFAVARMEKVAKLFPDKAEIYDVLHQAHLDLFNFDAALHAISQAVGLTPHNIDRLQLKGQLLFKKRMRKDAFHVLHSVFLKGKTSFAFNHSNLVLLALMRENFDRKKDFDNLNDYLAAYLESHPKSYRLTIVESLMSFITQCELDAPVTDERIKSLIAAIKDPSLDVDTALSMYYTFANTQERIDPDLYKEFVAEFGSRFLVSQNYLDIVLMESVEDPLTTNLLKKSYEEGHRRNQELITLSSTQPEQALEDLTVLTKNTLNSRHLQTAYGILNRDKDRLPGNGYEEHKKRLDQLKSSAYFIGPLFTTSKNCYLKSM